MNSNKAIFLDRDGVINDNSLAYYVYKKEDFRINKGVIDCLLQLQLKGYLLIIISNQGGIAKGQYNKQDVDILHEYLNSLLMENNIRLTAIHYCPHHSDISKCLCRKPNSLLLEKAIAKYKIDVNNSLIIGDSERDIIAAENVGIKGIRVKANANLLESIIQSHYNWLLE